jgi:hypothetical protein
MNKTSILIDWEMLVKVLSALLTPAIALVTTYIAWQQHNTNRRQLRLALFDRRLRVFDSTIKLIVTILRNAIVQLNELYSFLSETSQHEFLFGPDIGEYIDEVYGKAVQLEAQAAAQLTPQARTALLLWFSGQSDEARKKFGKYMAFTEPQ